MVGGKIFVEVSVRGTFTLSATNAEFPKSNNAAAVGGSQAGSEGIIHEGQAWIVVGCAGKRFVGMPADFVANTALLVAATNNPATASDWIIEESTVSSTTPIPNQNPVVSIASPAADMTVQVNTAVAIVYTASDPDGTLVSVKLVVNGVEQNLTPTNNTFTYTPTQVGVYAIAVRAVDNQGASVTSIPRSITAMAVSGNTPPSVSINSPTVPQTIAVGQSVTLQFTASDADGTIANIKLMVNGVEQPHTASGNTFTYTPNQAGTYNLAVRVTDNSGASVSSTPVSVTANVVDGNETLVRAINLGDASRTFGGITYESWTLNATPPNVSATVLYFNNVAEIQSRYTPPIASVEQYEAIRSFGYNIQTMKLFGLANGRYTLYLVCQRLYTTVPKMLRINGQEITIQAGESAAVWLRIPVQVTVTDGTITIHDPETVNGESGTAISYLELYAQA